MDLDLLGFLENKHLSNTKISIVSTDKGKDLTFNELVNYCRWGIKNGYVLLSQLPEYETIDELNNQI